METDEKIIIGLDANEANLKKRVGVNNFALNLIWGLYQLRKEKKQGEKYLLFLQREPLADLPPAQSWWSYEVLGRAPFWTRTLLVKRLYFGRPKPRVFFSPSHYGPVFCPVPLAVSVMDLGFLRFPAQFQKKDLWQLKNWTRRSVKRAAKIITISEFTKKDLLKNYRLKKSKVIVAYPGFQPSPKKGTTTEKVKEKYQIKSDYLLYLGTLKPSKNISGLLEAFGFLRQKNPDLKITLVIAGKKGWLFKEIFIKVKELNLEKEVIFTDFVKEEEISGLMKGARAFLIPSFWEGFGLPALEAMSLGVPVVASKAGSLPEIIGKGGVLVDPYRPAKIAAGIEKVLGKEKLRKKIIAAGLKRAKCFSWRKCSKIVRLTLINLAKKNE